MVKKKDNEEKESFFKKGGEKFESHEEIDRKEFPRTRSGSVPNPAIAKHKVVEGETLSGIAQKHYGHSTRDYWMVIYESNKDKIGGDPGILKPGIELMIPELPANLKDK